jgi:hypothetical protein
VFFKKKSDEVKVVLFGEGAKVTYDGFVDRRVWFCGGRLVIFLGVVWGCWCLREGLGGCGGDSGSGRFGI